MSAKSRRRPTDLETNVSPGADALPDDLRREDPRDTPPDSMPPRRRGRRETIPAGGGFTPAEDGGNPQHPVHDEPEDDATPSDYEREIDRVDAATRKED